MKTNLDKIRSNTVRVLVLLMTITTLFSCKEDRDVMAGLPEYEHHYYIVYVPNNNSAVTVKRSQTALLELPVQFYSEFERSYDAVANYIVSVDGINNPAEIGKDFEVVDASGNKLNPIAGKYELIFPKAKKDQAKIYIKLLNNSAATGRRTVAINLQDNVQEQFRVDIFSTAFKRTINID